MHKVSRKLRLVTILAWTTSKSQMIMPKFNPYELEVTQMRDPYALFQPLFAFSKWYDTLMLNLISFCILKVKILIPSRNQSEDQQKPGFHFSPLVLSLFLNRLA